MLSDLFKKDVPKMPEGYYSGDKPNPNLRAFVEAHIKENPYNPETDDYDVPAFDKPIETTKATAIYNMHTYWSKKPHDAIREYIRHYTKPGDLVLDPFCGSGGTALAALIEGRKAIAIDLSPAATFITKGYCQMISAESCNKFISDFLYEWKNVCSWSHDLKCPKCGKVAVLNSVIHSDRYECLRCMSAIAIYDCIDRTFCPHCREKVSLTKNRRIDMVPVKITLFCKHCGYRGQTRESEVIDDYIQRTTEIIELNDIKIPHVKIPDARVNTGRMKTTGTRYVDDLYYPRSLYCIGHAFEIAGKKDNEIERGLIQFCLTSMCLFVTKMHQANENTGGNISKGSYYIPPVNKEMNVFDAFMRKANTIVKATESIDLISKQLIISTESATEIYNIASNSVDYIFTDPPYSDKVPFSDLNLPWEVWLDFNYNWTKKEIIVHPDQGKGIQEWKALMYYAFKRMYDVLKPGHWLSLCYHDTSEGTWSIIQDLAFEVGFIPDSIDTAIYIETNQKSFQQVVADKVNKRDLIVNFRKPRPGEVVEWMTINGDENENTFVEKVHIVISQYLMSNPGANKDRIYDEVVSRMVRAGRMEAHNFDELLRQVADEIRQSVKKDLFQNEDPNLFGTHEISRWYLKESQLSVQDSAETVKEDVSAESIKKYISKRLKDDPSLDGIHYSDLFEHYIYAVKDKPRRALAECLPDYFFKTVSGTWRLPQSDEEEKLKSDVRYKGTNRKIKHYIAYLEQGVPVPDKERPNDATLAEWIRQCKRSGLFEQGKLLYEKGGLNLDNFTEEAMVEVEEDYQVCVRSLLRK